ncbi:hypothetical protein [Nocardia aurantiaca]|uniref:Uncharacterized protein n=1 Tax=Nocardia aurantiaca TaxID=2675850 RepID=A0A6I3KUP0_9NOCA|nr:hypothetical protein [Nocardia aurantiaca]MTE13682.1 hypothetical protein [Nocardia aurantiaca]
MANPLLLATHITIALALTILVGVQSTELARIRLLPNETPTAEGVVRTVRLTLLSIPVFTLLTAVTGVAVLADGAKGGPWIGAGLLSTAVIGASSGWTRRRLNKPEAHRTGVLAAVQWGVPAQTLVAAFLMADRPDNPALAFAPVLLALAVTVTAYLSARRVASGVYGMVRTDR